jgi:hypothetical protein
MRTEEKTSGSGGRDSELGFMTRIAVTREEFPVTLFIATVQTSAKPNVVHASGVHRPNQKAIELKSEAQI